MRLNVGWELLAPKKRWRCIIKGVEPDAPHANLARIARADVGW